MADRLWNLLMRFHREVVKPDVYETLMRFHREVVKPEVYETLMRFHREVFVPDVERIVDERVDERVGALRNEMLTSFDGVYKRFDRLENEYESLSAAVRRIEEQHQNET